MQKRISGPSGRKRPSAAQQVRERIKAEKRARRDAPSCIERLEPSDTLRNAVLYLRVSGGTKNQKRSLQERLRDALGELAELRYRCPHAFTERGPGLRVDRPKLRKALAICQQKGWPLVVEEPTRLVRNPEGYHLNPTAEQVERVLAATPDVVVLSLYDPAEGYEAVHRARSLDRQASTPRKNGRPEKATVVVKKENTRRGEKKAVREKWAPRVVGLKRLCPGLSLREIATEWMPVEVGHVTVGRWIAKANVTTAD